MVNFEFIQKFDMQQALENQYQGNMSNQAQAENNLTKSKLQTVTNVHLATMDRLIKEAMPQPSVRATKEA